MERVQCIAVDWSGAIARGYQREHIWLAVAELGRLIRLETGPESPDLEVELRQ